MSRWLTFARQALGRPLVRSLRYPVMLGVLWAGGYLAVVVANQGRSAVGTTVMALFAGAAVALAAFVWRDPDRPLRAAALATCAACACPPVPPATESCSPGGPQCACLMCARPCPEGCASGVCDLCRGLS